MFLRLLLLLLLALNIGVAGWLTFGQPQRTMPPLTDPGVPKLELLSSTSGAPASVTTAARAIKASGQCLRIGPFATRSGMHKAFEALTPHVPQIQFNRDQVTKSMGWWVYLPAFATRAEALDAARALVDGGVQDYYVITAGDHQNMVSLGLFRNPDNARRRFDHIAQLGFDPKLTERKDTLPEYWIDIALPAAPGFDWQAWVNLPTVQATAIDCF
ncbi:MAG TPA: SPOR domain-containing protein [Oleiagrimonas sp.]|nr:SPOR domain-containing protein [Oleiagrimonas sp.]